jgi:transposase-like protein
MMALIGRTPQHVVWWIFAERESYDSWDIFCSHVPAPSAVVCDGQRGLFAAIRGYWPKVPFQRCLIHVLRQALAKLTLHPKTPAGQDLRKLVRQLPTIRTRRQKRRWIRRWKHWRRKYHRFLTERSYGDIQNKRRSWWYTHKKLRAVRSLIQNSLPYLFTFIGHPEIPKTSNHVEGGINSRLKELLHRHRGLNLIQKQALVSWFLALKQPQKPPRNVT